MVKELVFTVPMGWSETQPGCPGWRRGAARTSASGDGTPGVAQAEIIQCS